MLLGSCQPAADPASSDPGDCTASPTPVSAVQGKGYSSPLAGDRVTVRGVVTRVEPGRGFWLEDISGSRAARASRALFVDDAAGIGTVRSGQQVQLGGRVTEAGGGRDTLTTLTDIGAPTVCGANAAMPLTHARLPLDSRAREALEGMRLAFGQELSVTDHYKLYRGEVTLSADGPLRLPTEDADPGTAARQRATQNRRRSLGALLPGPEYPALPVASQVTGLTGIMGHDGERQRFLPENWQAAPAEPPPAIPPPAAGTVRIVSANLLNFFNGNGLGGGFPTERGARTAEEFEAQKDRTRAAFAQMNPDLIGVQELENDGFDQNSAAKALRDLLNATGHQDWAVVDPGQGRIGGDVITVGLFYRQQVLEAIGSPELLQGPAFDHLSRQPMAQLFRHRETGGSLLVAVNHLKSKGRCPDSGPNDDRGDGQGCWNAARVDAVRALTPWLERLARRTGTANVLILGDMNAWRREDPIRAYRAAGYRDLVEALSGLPQYSFLYFGQRGTLDYAFATPTLAAQAQAARIWHINADWPRDMSLPRPWLRMSDHDPVVVDFDFSQSATSD